MLSYILKFGFSMFTGMLYMSQPIRGWSGASYAPMQPSFPCYMHCEVAQDERNVSTLQVQHSQGKRTGVIKGKGMHQLSSALWFLPLTLVWYVQQRKSEHVSVYASSLYSTLQILSKLHLLVWSWIILARARASCFEQQTPAINSQAPKLCLFSFEGMIVFAYSSTSQFEAAKVFSCVCIL